MANLVNLESVSHAFGTRVLLDGVSLGVGAGEVIGVVGRNGDGKTTLLRVLTGDLVPDSGRVTISNSASIGVLTQHQAGSPGETIRQVVLDGAADHVYAARADRREIVEALLAGVDLDRPVETLSGGERRRVGLVEVLLGDHDLIVLDEPTNHLDVEAIAFLASHLRSRTAAGLAMLVVSHDRWFLDAVCTRIWEVHDGVVDAYDGGYAAYVLARVERQRQAAATEARRKNLARKELAWLRRGAPARTSKPKFRIEAAEALISDVPPPRDRLALEKFATSRLGKDVFDLINVDYAVEDRTLLNRLTWSIGPGDRIGLVGVNGAGKTTLLDLLAGLRSPQSGKIKRGVTLRIGYLSQSVGELDDEDRVLQSVTRLKQATRLATGREVSAGNLLEEFGFTGDKLVARIGDLSGGERRRLQFLRLLLEEPNVLLLDEPTNDLDIATLQLLEEYLADFRGCVIVVSHDRYFMDKVVDHLLVFKGDGVVDDFPGNYSQYREYLQIKEKEEVRERKEQRPDTTDARKPIHEGSDRRRKLTFKERREFEQLETEIEQLETEKTEIHGTLSSGSASVEEITQLSKRLPLLEEELEEKSMRWLELSEFA